MLGVWCFTAYRQQCLNNVGAASSRRQPERAMKRQAAAAAGEHSVQQAHARGGPLIVRCRCVGTRTRSQQPCDTSRHSLPAPRHDRASLHSGVPWHRALAATQHAQAGTRMRLTATPPQYSATGKCAWVLLLPRRARTHTRQQHLCHPTWRQSQHNNEQTAVLQLIRCLIKCAHGPHACVGRKPHTAVPTLANGPCAQAARRHAPATNTLPAPVNPRQHATAKQA